MRDLPTIQSSTTLGSARAHRPRSPVNSAVHQPTHTGNECASEQSINEPGYESRVYKNTVVSEQIDAELLKEYVIQQKDTIDLTEFYVPNP